MATVTADMVQEWRRLAEAATPGEWTGYHSHSDCESVIYDPVGNGGILFVAPDRDTGGEQAERNVMFAIAARAAVPTLCDALEAAWAERDAALAHWRNWSAIRQDLADTNARMWREAETARQTEGQQAAAEIAKLTAERDALAAELASYQRGAAAIAQAVDEYGRYVP